MLKLRIESVQQYYWAEHALSDYASTLSSCLILLVFEYRAITVHGSHIISEFSSTLLVTATKSLFPLIHCCHLMARKQTNWTTRTFSKEIKKQVIWSHWFYLIHITIHLLEWKCNHHSPCNSLQTPTHLLQQTTTYSMSKSSGTWVPSPLTQGRGKGT